MNTERKAIGWERGEALYLDLPEHEEEIFVYYDGEIWNVLEMKWDGYHEKHYADDSGAEFADIEAARLYAEGLIAQYEAEASKEDTEQNPSN